MPLLNYTTKIDPDKTASEIARCLSIHGASAILTEYSPEDNLVTALSFKITVSEQEVGFRLPVDWHPVYEIMAKGKKFPWDTKRKEKMQSDLRLQAVRTAWRIVKDWVESQMALVETKMVSTGEVFLPYMVMRNGQTLSQKMQENPQFLLGSGE